MEERERYYDVEVTLLAMTRPVGFTDLKIFDDNVPVPTSVEDLIEWASRLCVDKLEGTGAKESYIQERISQGHESVIEHGSMTFHIRCSRVLTHELVRHRIASYTQRSQRYVREEGEPRYITPPEVAYCERRVNYLRHGSLREGTAIEAYHHVVDTCWDVYSALLAAGVSPEIARYVLPNACETQIVCTYNFRELRHIIKLRTSSKALPEMQAIAGQIRDICKKYVPRVFEDM